MSSTDLLDQAARAAFILKEALRSYELEKAIQHALDLPRSYFAEGSIDFTKFRAEAIAISERYQQKIVRVAASRARDLDEEVTVRELHRYATRFLDNLISSEAFRKQSTFSDQQTESRRTIAIIEQCQKAFSGSSFSLGPVTFEIREGDVFALMGPNASGKSTLLRIILGELAISSGRITYPGLPHSRTYRGQRSNLGYVPQFPPPWHGPLKQNLHYYLSSRGVTGTENRQRVEYYLHRFQLTRYQDSQWDEISGGYKLRAVLARELLLEPALLILDEPLAHLDVESQFYLLDIIKTISTRPIKPTSVVLTSQHIYETERFCSKIVVLNEGKVVALGTQSDLSDLLGMASLFELETSAPIRLLQSSLKSTQLQIRGELPIYILRSKTHRYDMKTLIELLSSNDIAIISLRDISSSSRYFFGNASHDPLPQLTGRNHAFPK